MQQNDDNSQVLAFDFIDEVIDYCVYAADACVEREHENIGVTWFCAHVLKRRKWMIGLWREGKPIASDIESTRSQGRQVNKVLLQLCELENE